VTGQLGGGGEGDVPVGEVGVGGEVPLKRRHAHRPQHVGLAWPKVEVW